MTNHQSQDFPSELLVAESGTISGNSGKYFITIKLKPFNFDDEDVNQELKLENVALPAEIIENLSETSFDFPPNPNVGYVESSIYIWSVHNPIDVLHINFGKVKDEYIEATFVFKFIFDYEGCSNNLDKTLSLPLEIR